MDAVIIKSIGNTFLIKSGGVFYDIVFWKRASKLVNSNTNIADTISACPREVEVNERKESTKKELKKLLSIEIQWVDKLRTLKSITDLGIQESIIYVQDYTYSESTTKFTERENPKVTYYLKIGGFELNVKKAVFLHFANRPIIKQKRAV